MLQLGQERTSARRHLDGLSWRGFIKMGKALASLCLSAIATFGIAISAQAVESEIIHNPADTLVTGSTPYSHTFTSPFDPSQWVIDSAELWIFVYDDSQPFFSDLFQGETVRFTFDGTSWGTQQAFLNLANFDLSGNLFSDGLLTMLLEATQGDFNFGWAKLVLNATRRVSEPGTLALLGLALMGLGFAARRRAV